VPATIRNILVAAGRLGEVLGDVLAQAAEADETV